MWLLRKLGKKYFLEISGWRKDCKRTWVDNGVRVETEFFDIGIRLEYDPKRNDHSPGLYIYISIFYWNVLEFAIYSGLHAEDYK
jgi:hypothetical protein